MTAPSIDAVSGLVEELRARTTRVNGLPLNSDTAVLCSRAADALEAQARELAEFLDELGNVEVDGWRSAAQKLKAVLSACEENEQADKERIAALEDAVRVKDEALSKAVVFDIGVHHFVESRGDGTWAIKNGGCVLNIDGDWEYEPMPSNRTAEFIARTRFDFEEAMSRARTAHGEPHDR